jgi:TolB-like protein/Tfp pilus assembly protein PilF
METLASGTNRLAVLPAQEFAGPDGEEAYFCDGFVIDLITELSRFPEIDVISPHSSFAPRLRGLEDAAIAAELGVDLVLKFGVRKRKGSVRINAQLVDLRTGSLLWAERYDAALDEIFDIQDSVVEKISAALPRQIRTAKLESARRKPQAELEAYDWWLRGMEKLRKGNLEGDEEARERFEKALERDPHFARAFVGLSMSHFNEWSCQHWELSELSECRAYQYALKAYELEPRDAQCHIVLARVYYFRREFERAEDHLKRALELNPNDADALVMIGAAQAFMGRADEGAETFERAVRLNPFFEPWYFAYGGFIKIMQKKFAEGIEMGLKAPLTTVWIDLAAFIALAYAYQGNLEEAAVYRGIFMGAFREKITGGREPEPGAAFEWLMTVNPFKREEDTEFYRDGLERAGFARGAAGSERVDTPTWSALDEKPGVGPARPVFRLENQLRWIAFGGTSFHLPEVKGFRDIEALLQREGSETHCMELMGSDSEEGGACEVMDARARQDCAARIRELQSELLEAEENNDYVRAEKVREELDPLLDHLAKAVGIGGKSRRLAGPAERARSAVTWRIRSAIKKIEAASAPVGRHFANSIRTGTFCSYCPEKPVSWLV